MNSIDQYKHITWAVLLVLTLLGAFFPFIVRLRKKSQTVISFFICFAAGVIIGTMLMHMVPHLVTPHSHSHAAESVALANAAGAATGSVINGHHHSHDGHDHSHDGHNHSHGGHNHSHGGHNHEHGGHNHEHEDHDQHHSHDGHDHSHDGHHADNGQSQSHGSSSQTQGSGHPENVPYEFGLLAAGLSFFFLVAIDRLFLSHSHCEDVEETCEKKKLPCDPESGHVRRASIVKLDSAVSDSYSFGVAKTSSTSLVPSISPKATHAHSHGHSHGHDHCHEDSVSNVGGCHMDGISSASSKLHALSFVLAIGVHSFFESLGLGAATTSSKLWGMFIGIAAHKALEALTLGIAIMKARFSRIHTVLFVVGFSLISPIGVLVGRYALGAVSYDPSSPRAVVERIMNGLAVGSFLFIACIEMIPAEFHKKDRYTGWKLLTVVCGFALMAGLAKIHID